MRHSNSTLEKNERGFTLTELLVVIALVGLILAVSMPAFQTYYLSFKLRTSMRQMTSDLRKIRQTAISEVRAYRMNIDPALDVYELYKLNVTIANPDPDQTAAASWTSISPRKPLAQRVDIFDDSDFPHVVADDPNGDDTVDVVFTPNGTPQVVGMFSMQMPIKNAKYDRYEVNVNAIGKVEVTGGNIP